MNNAAAKPPLIVLCPYCAAQAILLPDTSVYGRSYGGMVWVCQPCKAWVGCHKNSKDHRPLGRLATAELRKLKIEAHALFDPLWQAAMKHRGWSKTKARAEAYRWLSKKMELPCSACHIGMFDESTVRKSIEVLRKREPAPATSNDSERNGTDEN